MKFFVFLIPLVLVAHGLESMECVNHLDCPLSAQSCVYGQCRVVREFAGDGAPESAPATDQCHPECPDNYNCINGKCIRYAEESRGRVKKSWPECAKAWHCYPRLNLCDSNVNRRHKMTVRKCAPPHTHILNF